MGHTSNAVKWGNNYNIALNSFDYLRLSQEMVHNLTYAIFFSSSIHILYCIRMTVTCAHGLVVIADLLSDTGCGSSLIDVKP
jgi:hypothetical protein